MTTPRRVSMNPVTHILEVTELTPVQLALERCVQTIDGQRLKLTNAEAQELVRRLQESLLDMLPNSGHPM